MYVTELTIVLLLRFHRLPNVSARTMAKDRPLVQEHQQAWLKTLQRQAVRRQMYRNMRICACHFVHGQPAALKKQHDPDWVPSISLGYEQLTTDSQAARLAFTFALSQSIVFIVPMMILCLGHVVKGGGKEKK